MTKQDTFTMYNKLFGIIRLPVLENSHLQILATPDGDVFNVILSITHSDANHIKLIQHRRKKVYLIIFKKCF